MMFQGTYTSEFYRAIRKLIHDQVALQMLEKDVPAGQNSAAKRALERRWHDLLTLERLHRSQGRQAAHAGDTDRPTGLAQLT
jgi:anaerobic magnesium-protoporphyrin IX monomethyl ester cyclase